MEWQQARVARQGGWAGRQPASTGLEGREAAGTHRAPVCHGCSPLLKVDLAAVLLVDLRAAVRAWVAQKRRICLTLKALSGRQPKMQLESGQHASKGRMHGQAGEQAAACHAQHIPSEPHVSNGNVPGGVGHGGFLACLA